MEHFVSRNPEGFDAFEKTFFFKKHGIFAYAFQFIFSPSQVLLINFPIISSVFGSFVANT